MLLGFLAWNQNELRVNWKLRSARDALAQRDPERALVSLAAARELNPTSGEVEYLFAKAWRRLGRLDKVHQSLERASKLGFDVNLLRREQWLAAAQAGQMSIAEPHLSDLLIDPQDQGAEICEAYVNGYFRIGNPLKAFPLIKAWKQEFPDDDRPWICEGSFHETRENWELAEQHYREALQRAPSQEKTTLLLAKVLVKQHKFRDAESLFGECLKEQPDSPDVLEGWADCLWEMGRTEDAKAIYQKMLKINADSQFARWGYARWLVLNQKYEQALDYLEPLVEEFPYEKEYRHALSRALQVTGQSERASEQYRWLAEADAQLARGRSLEDQLKHEPNNVSLRYELGTIRLHYSSPEEGVRMLLSVLDIDPSHSETRHALEQYYREHGNDQLAKRFADNPQKSSSAPSP